MPSGYIYTVDIHTGYMSAEYARGKQRFRLGTDTKTKRELMNSTLHLHLENN